MCDQDPEMTSATIEGENVEEVAGTNAGAPVKELNDPCAPPAPPPGKKKADLFQSCDVIMKGGITSGILYPTAIHELSKTYRFRSVGGASAGAIVAATTAAAEYARQKTWKSMESLGDAYGPPTMDSTSFEILNGLPDQLTEVVPGTNTRRLVQLFTPTAVARPVMNTLLATMSDIEPPDEDSVEDRTLDMELADDQREQQLIDSKNRLLGNYSKPPGRFWKRLFLFLPGAIRNFPWAAFLGTFLASLFIWTLVNDRGGVTSLSTWSKLLYFVALAGTVIVVVAICVSVAFALRLLISVKRNDYGMCVGHNEGYDIAGADSTGKGANGVEPYLTDWLEYKLCEIAGILGNKNPLTDMQRTLTFCDLKKEEIDLKIVTTNLTQGRPNCLPFIEEIYYFCPDEMAKFFPPHVVEWMVKNPRAGTLPLPYQDGRTVLPMPSAQDLPIVVAIRMSMAFPILLATIPLYAVDYRYVYNDASETPGSGIPASKAIPTRCNFSDGGICSNMPIQFFDSFLPNRPTFGFNFVEFHPDHPRVKGKENEGKNVWLPDPLKRVNQVNTWPDIRQDSMVTSLVGFGFKILDGARNWADNAQLQLPGYRDRVVNIGMDDDEGGLNLKMGEIVVERLKKRGRAAARLLVDQFSEQDGAHSVAWMNHRWVRFRTIMAQMEDLLEKAKCINDDPNEKRPNYMQLLQVSLEDDMAVPTEENAYAKDFFTQMTQTPVSEISASEEIGSEECADEVGTNLKMDGGLVYQFTNPESRDRAIRQISQLIEVAKEWASDESVPFNENQPRPHSTLQNRPDF